MLSLHIKKNSESDSEFFLSAIGLFPLTKSQILTI